jgi:hypothetical protein
VTEPSPDIAASDETISSRALRRSVEPGDPVVAAIGAGVAEIDSRLFASARALLTVAAVGGQPGHSHVSASRRTRPR